MVEIAQGKLVGITENGISSFKGIPFAAPPVGDLRWFPPQPHEGWEGSHDAGDFGNGLPGWPATTEGNDLLLEFDQTGVTIHRDFREARRAFWEQHFDARGL